MLTDQCAIVWKIRYDAVDNVNEDVGIFMGDDNSGTGYGMKNTYRLDKLSSVGGTYLGSTTAERVLGK